MRRYRRRLLLSQPQLCSPVQLRNGQIEVWHQRISISCWAGACAVGRCGRRMSVKNMQCDQRGGRGAEQDESAAYPLFPVALGPAYVWWLKEVGSAQGESSKGAQRRWGVS